MNPPSASRRRASAGRTRVGLALVVFAVLVATLGSLGRSEAAFVALTSTTGNTFSTGTGLGIGALSTWGDNGDVQMVPAQLGTATAWKSLAVGVTYGCGIQTDNTLWCWGQGNAQGQQGLGDTQPHYLPTQVGSATWTQVATGAGHTCGVQSGGTLWCWGEGLFGKLGQNSTANSTVPKQVTSPSSIGWATVTTGNQFTCATRVDTTMWCFGRNVNGELGNGTTTTPQLTPTQVLSPLIGWVSVSAGYQHACALQADQTLYCWGDGGNGRLGVGNALAYTSPQLVSGLWSSIVPGSDHTCGIKTNNTLWCWGLAGNGRLGNGSTADVTTPAPIAAPTTWKAIVGGTKHSCGIRTDNTLWCWGANSFSQLGLNDFTDRTTGVQVGTAATWATLAPGPVTNQVCATQSSGTLWCWGDDGRVKFLPSALAAGTTWKAAAPSENYTCGVQSDGTLWCWGVNQAGRLGAADGASHYLPTQVGTATTWRQVTTGQYHACAVRTDTTLWCWGLNDEGQLGQGTTTSSNVPLQVTSPAATGWAQVSAGSRFNCATRTDTTLYCFGNNNMGQIGVGVLGGIRSSPLQVTTPAATGWNFVSDGYQHVCANRTDHTMYCWGDGGSGRLGTGATVTSSAIPLTVAGSAWWLLALGTDHSCAIKINGTLWCWGAGGSGRLGNGTSTDRNGPAQVGTSTQWRLVAGGNTYTCGIQSDASVWCWGSNLNGQLGLGIAVPSALTPTQLPGLTGWPVSGGSMAASVTFIAS